MLLVYIGEAASISFLKFVRDTVSAQIGPSQFSHNDQNENMLEMEPTIAVPESITPAIEDLDATRREDYIHAYRAAVSVKFPSRNPVTHAPCLNRQAAF